ncbi:tape measure protein [Novosphingobium sp.]|uniref:tape measure protein n=1 Tax=Novosphingobium sp. TaxID=1874826 RepID=UPI0028AF9C34|nr:tape measure protein [Novosphingobium sp.]
MAEVDPVTLRLFVDNNRAISELTRYARAADQSFSSVSRGAVALERSLSVLGGAFAGVSAAAMARAFLDIADTAKTLDAQLRLATTGFGSFAQAQEDVRRIAANTRSGLEETAALYGNFSRASKEIGADQDDAARATETFSKTLKISGADANQAASATLQFGQALAAGALRGDELNSILEASPRLARLLTESMGVPIGAIKQLGEEGKLTSDKLLNALTNTKFTAGIDAEFRELPVTFDDAMTQVYNAAIITFGAFDRGGQFSTALANFITDGSDGFKQLEDDAVEMGIAVRASIEGLADAFNPVMSAAQRFFAYMKEGIGDVSFDPGRELRDLDNVTGALSGGESRVEQWINKRLWGQESGRTNFEGRYREGQAAADRRLRGEMGERAANDLISRYFDRSGNPIRNAAPAKYTPGPSASEQKSAQRKAEAAARKAEQERLRAIRDDASKQRDAASLQDDINAAKAALTVATGDVLKFNLQQIDSEKAQRIAEYQTQHDLGRLSAQELADRTAAVNQIADLQRQRVQQIAEENRRRDALDVTQASSKNDADLLRAQAELSNTRQERRAIELRLLDLAYDQEQAELEGVLASQTATEAQKQIAQARLNMLASLKGFEVERTNREYESPLEQRRREVRETTANMADAAENIELSALDRLSDGLGQATADYVKLGGVAGDVINGIIQDLIKLAVQQTLIGKGGGGIFSLFGIGGSTSSLSGVDYGSLASAAASVKIPGFASGGYTGDGPANQAAGIVHKGEFVVPADAVKRIGVENLAAMSNARAAASMAGVTAAGSAPRPVQQTVVVQVEANDYFDARVKQGAAAVAQPIGMAAAVQARTDAGTDVARQARRRIPGR